MSLRLVLLLLPLGLGLLACRKTTEGMPDAGALPATSSTSGNDFTMADLVAATRVDACVARLSAFSTEYKMALTFDRGPRLVEHTDRLAKPLDEAAAATERAFDEVRDPRDRLLAAPLVTAARRWPTLLRETRTELLGPPNIPVARAAQALAAADEDMARALEAYRGFRSAWRISDAPDETPAVVEFLRVRRALELAETELGRGLQRGLFPTDGGPRDLAQARKGVDQLVTAAREVAGRVGGERQPSAQRWVEAQARALGAILALAAPGGAQEELARRSLEYQIAKVEALEAVAEYTRLTARHPSTAR